LASAQSDTERNKIEEKMRSDEELSDILLQLRETEQEDLVQEERARRASARKSRVDAGLEAMDTNESQVGIRFVCTALLFLVQNLNVLKVCDI